MSTVWWVIAVAVAWFAAGGVVALLLGPVLRRCSDAREAQDTAAATMEMDVHPS